MVRVMINWLVYIRKLLNILAADLRGQTQTVAKCFGILQHIIFLPDDFVRQKIARPSGRIPERLNKISFLIDHLSQPRAATAVFASAGRGGKIVCVRLRLSSERSERAAI